ncbi:MAG TPA: hypothetical protein VKV28_00650 [Candidatus Binataceae bacterium]|nr:hypothetical protein [Candidatus Binataceae bacterium]
MTEQNISPKEEDVIALAGEMRELKEILREVSGKLGRIEKRLRAFFPSSFPSAKTGRVKLPQLNDSPPTITPQQALDLYTELIDLARSGQERQVETRVAEMGLGNLALLVKELGAPLGKKPSRPALMKSLMGRLKESIMLSRHTNRPATTSFAEDSGRGNNEEPGQASQAPAADGAVSGKQGEHETRKNESSHKG